MSSSYHHIRNNDDAYDFSAYACATEVDGEMFVEHDVTGIEVTVNSHRCMNEMVEINGCDNERVERFNDSEEERIIFTADGFDGIDVSLPINKDVSDDDNGPNFEKFRKYQLNKNFKFKWSMQFNSPDDFREENREWSVLNGREITFVKNESYRVRVECRDKCGFLMLCSKVGHKHTYSIKIIIDNHTCDRVLDSRFASSRWVAKAVVKKMKTSDTVRIWDIIQDMRHNYSVGITMSRAWKEKLIVKKIIKGDADKQYANLWRYVVELQRVNSWNTMKINVDRPNPSIQPRFKSFYFCFDGCKRGFINGCRPFVRLDGCHLKTKYDGQLLIIMGRDPNDQDFPLSFGVVETKIKDSWR
ncbi:hypothetical protein KIW84_010843 [Lathyrus oleraceus]|uniref:Transposase MuDR plant domain-containing protein n=1 Tax=Pisum sativum TaxID=3888 RepID=A0A9D5BA99_PEA|nr:hypothetical protein KIW84_010843 [Pisum sativum]